MILGDKVMKRLGILLVCIGVLSPITGCGGKKLSRSSEREALVEATNTFTFDLHRKLVEDGTTGTGGNLFSSPLCASMALALAYAGAREQTAQQMEKVLGLESLKQRVHPAYHDLLVSLRQGAESHDLYLGSRLWAHEGLKFRDEFARTLRQCYGEKPAAVDFEHDLAGAHDAVARWVRDTTHGRIKDAAVSQGVDTLTRMLLTSVIYFKGRWKYEFNPDATDDEEFHLLTGENATVSMMHQAGRFKYAFLDGCKLLEMPYTGEEVSMTLILPNGSLPDFEEGLTWKTVANWMDKMEVTKDVDVKIPRFRMQTRMPLTEVLQAMGLTDVFINPDFSAMTGGTAGPPISAIDQEGYIDVNEEGTEAYVVTRGSWFIRSGKETPVFHADHPFVFLIRDLRTGSILFIGRFVDPRHQAEAES